MATSPSAARGLADAKRKRATLDNAKRHHDDAKRAYRASVLKAFESGTSVTLLSQTFGTSWAAMDKVLKRAKAERHLAKTNVMAGE